MLYGSITPETAQLAASVGARTDLVIGVLNAGYSPAANGLAAPGSLGSIFSNSVQSPLNTQTSYATTKPFAQAVAQLLEKQHPELVVSRMSKDLRPGRVFIDWSQNDQHKTTVSVYSLRARGRPTVSAPLAWGEVERAVRAGDPAGLTFEAGEMAGRIARHGDLFEPMLGLRQELPRLG